MSKDMAPDALPSGQSADSRALAERLSDAVRASQRATDEVDQLVSEILSVNRTDGRCMDVLDQLGRISAGELAAATRLSTGAITAVIDRLERDGYARRVPDPADRRRVLVELTPRARELTWELYGPLAEAAEPLIMGYTDAELELLIEFQRRGIELQEEMADRLRQKLSERRRGSGG